MTTRPPHKVELPKPTATTAAVTTTATTTTTAVAAAAAAAAAAECAHLTQLLTLSNELDALVDGNNDNSTLVNGNDAIDPAVAAAADMADWQARCVELEWSLHKFREQAQSIREMLREKVSTSALDIL